MATLLRGYVAKCLSSSIQDASRGQCNGTLVTNNQRAADVHRGPFSLKTFFFAVFGLRSGLDGSGQAVGFIWFLFRAKSSILNPFRPKFDVFDWTQTFVSQDWNWADLGRLWPTLGRGVGRSWAVANVATRPRWPHGHMATWPCGRVTTWPRLSLIHI